LKEEWIRKFEEAKHAGNNVIEAESNDDEFMTPDKRPRPTKKSLGSSTKKIGMSRFTQPGLYVSVASVGN
jgi:hypothetical protein